MYKQKLKKIERSKAATENRNCLAKTQYHQYYHLMLFPTIRNLTHLVQGTFEHIVFFFFWTFYWCVNQNTNEWIAIIMRITMNTSLMGSCSTSFLVCLGARRIASRHAHYDRPFSSHES